MEHTAEIHIPEFKYLDIHKDSIILRDKSIPYIVSM